LVSEVFCDFFSVTLQHFSCRSTTVGTLHATFLQSFGYGDVVHQFEKRCNCWRNSGVTQTIRKTNSTETTTDQMAVAIQAIELVESNFTL